MTNSSLKLLITGGNGQLAQAMRYHARANEFQLIFCTQSMLNICDPSSIAKAITTYQPDIIINTAAYTAVDKAELESEHALQVNHLGAQQLAIACEQHHIPLIHLSTDYIFDGEKKSPYLESDIANPINAYGYSKYLGEQEVRLHTEKHTILRTSGVFSEYGVNFLKTIAALAKEKTELRIVADQTICPTYAGDIAEVIFSLAHTPTYGTYHFCSAQPTTWHQFALAIAEEEKKYSTLSAQTISAITTADYPTAAKRPVYSVLDCSKIKRELHIQQPSWQSGIKQSIKGMHT
jgi:dTDP-4-dehydrorhamnose reductase